VGVEWSERASLDSRQANVQGRGRADGAQREHGHEDGSADIDMYLCYAEVFISVWTAAAIFADVRAGG
tara:strand:+ start:195 stop:398 length:204 start_codon:yes stop_codon:yes gene_type:complete